MLGRHIHPVASSLKKHDLLNYLSILGVVLGVLIRLIQYISNRSLWSDEAMLALNIVDRSYLDLLKPLDYNQAAPPLFLFIEKLAVQIFGNNEYALRLFPCTAGIMALIAFYKLANRYTCKVAAPIAIILFACLRYTLYYSTEVKQYASDGMVAVLLGLWLIPLRHQRLTSKQLLFLSLCGALFIWLSHPTVFVLAGIEIGYLLIASNRQRWMMIVNRLPMYLTWLASFVSLYMLTIRGTLENDSLISSWDRRYPDSLLDLSWLFNAFGRFFYNPLGFSFGILHDVAMLAFIVGCIAYYRRNRMILVALIAPMFFTIIASYLEKYPFRDRLALFLVPFAILILAEGIAFLLSQTRYRLLFFIGALMLGTLLIPPVVRAAQLAIQPAQVEELRPVIAYVKTHQQPGDRLYVYRLGRNQFKYYAPRFGYAPEDYTLGKPAMASGGGRSLKLSEEGVDRFKRDISRFKGEKRVWFVFCRTSEIEEQIFLSTVEPMGQQLDVFRQHNAFVYLYDLDR